jgi:hypothetical protein
MENPSLQIGDNNWAVKDGSILGYNIIQDNYLPQPITFTRASSATRVNAEGLIEGVRTNLALYSEQFDNAVWAGTVGVTKLANQAIAPDGTNTMDLITFPLSNSSISQGINVVSGQPYTFSVWLSTQSGTVDAEIGNVNGGVFQSVTVTTTPTRFTITQNASAATRYPAIRAINPCSLLVWGAQLELSPSATDYIPTTTTAVSVGMLANIPRIDYTGGGFGKLLLEPQRTNIALRSEEFSNASSWVLTNSGTITANTTISPDGTQTADTLNAGANSAQVQQHRIGTSGAVYTVSIWVKRITGTGNVFLRAVVNADTLIAVTSDWQRFTATVTSIAPTIRIGVKLATSGDAVAIWGGQVELGSYATSYIPTTTTAVTRVKDTASKTGISSLIGQTEGTLFAEVEIPVNTQDGDIIAIRNGTGSANGIFVSYRSSSVVQLIVRTGSTNALIFQRSGSYAIGTNKIAVAYKNGDFAISLNGTAAQVNTSSITMPTSLDSVALFGDNMYAQTLPVPYAQALLFKTRLTNAELATLTTI